MPDPHIPATPDEAENFARQIVGEYLNKCRIADRSQIGNYLMKLVSVASVLMANAEGSPMAAARLMGTAEWVQQTMPVKAARLEKLQ